MNLQNPSLRHSTKIRRSWTLESPAFLISIYLAVSATFYLFVGEEPFGGYADEILILSLSLLSLPLWPLALGRRSFVYTALILLGFFLVEYISAIMNPSLVGYPVGAAATAGLIIDTKIFIIILSVGAIIIANDEKYIEDIVYNICRALIVFSLFNAIFEILDLFRGGFDVHGRQLSNRSGLTVPHGIFDHKYKSAFTNVMGYISCLAILSLSKRKISVILCLSLFLILTILTLSIKELIAVGAVTLLFAMKMGGLGNRVFVMGLLFWALLIMAFTDNIVMSTIGDRLTLFVNPDGFDTVRSAMYRQSLTIAFDYFPFGSGAGTFGSSPSRDMFYSPLYHEYGIAWLYGGGPDGGAFLLDTFWPKILAEGGFLGALLYAFLWFKCGMIVWRRIRSAERGIPFEFASMTFVALLIISLATPVYNYADGAIFGGIAMAVLLFERRRNGIASRRAP